MLKRTVFVEQPPPGIPIILELCLDSRKDLSHGVILQLLPHLHILIRLSYFSWELQ